MNEKSSQPFKDRLDEPAGQDMPQIKHLGAKTVAFIIAESLIAALLTMAGCRFGISQLIGEVFNILFSMIVSFLLIIAALKTYSVIRDRI